MSGIFAVASRGKPVSRRLIERAIATMAHRGPDASGVHVETAEFNGEKIHLGFGHVRLAILDLDHRSDQPFRKKATTLVYNGEIYNYRDIRSGLSGQTEFVTQGDTEVVSEALRLSGPDMLQQMTGHWALAFHEKGSGSLVVSRDRYGMKPLFYYRDENLVVISSTIRAIVEYTGRPLSFERDFLQSYLVYGVAPLRGNQSPYRQIAQITPGTFARIGFGDFAIREERYFDLYDLPVPPDDPDELAARLRSAVERTLISDRPLGLMLSGGVDSSLILSILATMGKAEGLTCFIGDAGKSEDAEYARKAAAALGIEPTVVDIDYEDFGFEHFFKACAHQERPFEMIGNFLSMPQMHARIAETDIRVVLDGTGADEIFGGAWSRYYPFAFRTALRHRDIAWLARSITGNFVEWRRFMEMMELVRRDGPDPIDPQVLEFCGHIAAKARDLDPLADRTLDYTEAMRINKTQGLLLDWLWQNDRNSMAYGVEARSPFLDQSLSGYVGTGYRKKYVSCFNKYEIRSIFDHFHKLPTQWRRQKQGFRWRNYPFFRHNHDRIFDLISASPTVKSLLEGRTGFIEQLRASDDPRRSKLVERLFCIAGVEEALAAKLEDG